MKLIDKISRAGLVGVGEWLDEVKLRLAKPANRALAGAWLRLAKMGNSLSPSQPLSGSLLKSLLSK